MADIQVVFLRDMLKVTKIEPKLSSSFPALTLTGKQFQSAAAVLINGIEAANFLPIGQSKIVVEIPESVETVTSVAVLSRSIVSTERSVISLRLGGPSVKVRGILRLVQRFVLMLLTNPGSDVYNPGLGGGLRQIIGKIVYQREGLSAKSTVQQSVTKTVKDIIGIQAKSTWLSPDERIASAFVLGIDFDPRTTTMAVRIQLDSESGQAAVVNLFE